MVSHSGPRAMYAQDSSPLSVSSQLSAGTEDTEDTPPLAPAPEVLCQPSPDLDLGLQTLLQFPAVHCSGVEPRANSFR